MPARPVRGRSRAVPCTPARPHGLRAALVLLPMLLLGLLAALVPAAPASADVDDFSYSSWSSQYEVSLDAEGRAVARITETLVAEFPEQDQNKGIIRGYPQRYLGAGLDIRIVSVTDDAGRPVPFEVDTEDDMVLVLTGTDEYVHGRTTYVIESTMRDFMVRGTDTGRDEFYWNLLPLDSTQDIARFDAEITFAPDLAAQLTGDVACYQGTTGQKSTCRVEGPSSSAEGTSFRIESGERPAGDGVTVAIGFTPGAVTQPAARRPDPVADFAAPISAGAALAAAAGVWVALAVLRRRRRTATGIIVAQFDVPEELSPLVAAPLIARSQDPIPAQIVHLAVQGALRLEEEEGGDRPVLRLRARDAVRHRLDRATLDALFPGDRVVRRIPKRSTRFAKRMRGLATKGAAQARRNGWLTKERSRAAMVFSWVSIALLAITVVLVVLAALKDRDLLPLSVFAAIVAAVGVGVSAISAFSRHIVPTRAGAERIEYLRGVHEFIRVAETDRLRMLQSYTGAERRADGSVDVVHLYEKLLPYAMLLGEERSWSRVLETRYAETADGPGWMDVAAGVAISSRLSSYSSSMHSAVSYTPSSSSSGGSTGGGFSGGGGGGGFSGGR
ncbi:DUF2207 domain-containing protein [Microbacterium sp. USHLN186]|uniref:DUF2207 domain-containing protein n=1 Tax=Microbacterium sp. USHLN186 TaxID=3081286 RepID=UPI003016EB58